MMAILGKTLKIVLLVSFVVLLVNGEQAALETEEPKPVLVFDASIGAGKTQQFGVIKYEFEFMQETVEMHMHRSRLVVDSDMTPDVMEAYKKALSESGDTLLCADGQRIAKDKCIKCDPSFAVSIVPCTNDPKRKTYLAFIGNW